MTTNPLRLRGATPVAGLLTAALLLAACGSSPEDAAVDDGPTDEVADALTDEPARDEPSDPEIERADDAPTDDAADGDETRVFEADNGDIEIPVAPEAVVAVGNAVMPVVHLGAEPVGVSVQDINTSVRWFTPEETADYEAAAPISDGSDVDMEAIASLEPDLIVIVVPAPVWEQSFAEQEDRYQAIAPTVFIANDALRWKEHLQRVGDALGRLDAVEAHETAYDEVVTGLRDEFDDVIASTTFALPTCYPQTEDGSFVIEHAGYWCTAYATEAGLDFPEGPDGEPSSTLSMEQLSDLAEYDAIAYPLDPDGSPREEFGPVIESNAWNALPAVAEGRAFGVICPSGQNYTNGIRNLESFGEALRELSDAG